MYNKETKFISVIVQLQVVLKNVVGSTKQMLHVRNTIGIQGYFMRMAIKTLTRKVSYVKVG